MRSALLVTLAMWGLFIGGGLLLQHCSRGLPHRPPSLNWGQGHNPGRNKCEAGTIPYYLDDGTFLECMRGHDGSHT